MACGKNNVARLLGGNGEGKVKEWSAEETRNKVLGMQRESRHATSLMRWGLGPRPSRLGIRRCNAAFPNCKRKRLTEAVLGEGVKGSRA